jgi:glycosyltransferase involved in cell wall biosynthesis
LRFFWQWLTPLAFNDKMQQDRYLSVIVPVYNEEGTIATVIDQLVELPGLLEIIVVDDCSSDRTPRILQEAMEQHSHIVGIRHEKNKGKTAALKTAIQRTRGSVVVIQDGDLEYQPKEISDLIKPILEGRADAVYGSRFLRRDTAICAYPQQYTVNRALTAVMNVAFGLRLTDVETCYKAFRGEILRKMRITSSGFGFEIEITARLAKVGYRILEHSITYRGRRYAAGKKVMPRDLLAAFFYVFRFSLIA